MAMAMAIPIRQDHQFTVRFQFFSMFPDVFPQFFKVFVASRESKKLSFFLGVKPWSHEISNFLGLKHG